MVKDIETSVFKRHPSSKVLIAATDEDRSALMVHEIAHVWCDAKEHPQGKIGIVEDIYDLLSAQQSIIFVNTRKDVSSITQVLKAKNFAVEVCEEVTREAVQIFGGMGYMRESVVERLYRDAKLLSIGGGTTEIMKELISRSL